MYHGIYQAGYLLAHSTVGIRHLRESDRAVWRKVRTASRELHQPWEPLPVPGIESGSDAAFDQVLATGQQSDRKRLGVFLLSTHELVAQVGLSQISRRPFQNAVLGYWGSALHAGKGYVAAGVRLVLSHCFGLSPLGLGLHRVEANVIPSNAASIRVVRRVGMRLEGFSPRYLEIAGTYQDHLRFAITMEEWDCTRHCVREGDSGAIR
jgi:ribosomal-protein-alanine N-acetyltransferase